MPEWRNTVEDCPVQRKTQVTLELCELDRVLGQLSELTKLLEKELFRVLRPPEPKSVAAESKSVEEEYQRDILRSGCELGDKIMGYRWRADRLVALVQGLRDRLEV